MAGRHVSVGDTRLFVEERGAGYPLIILHGGPGLDHHMFGDYLDALTDRHRLLLVDLRSNGQSDMTPESTWTLAQNARDVVSLAQTLGLGAHAVLGHSYGAFVALQHAVDFPAAAAQSIISSGLPSARFLARVDENLARFEPVELREQVTTSWAKEKDAQTVDDVARLLREQMPFHFRDPRDPRLAEFERRTAGAVYSPHVLRHFSRQAYGGIEAEDRLSAVTHPVLVLAGRYDRTCVVEGAETMARGLPQAELVVFENSAHMTFAEENEKYVSVLRAFLDKQAGAAAARGS